jgi:DNA replication protein DnaC
MATQITVPCAAGCGKSVVLKSDEDYASPAVEKMAKALAKNVRCEDCQAREQREELARRQAREFQERVASSGLPENLRRLTFDGLSPDDEAAGEAALSWAQSGRPRGLALLGAVGRGKTHLAAAACYEALRYRKVYWTSVGTLLTKMRAGYGERDRDHAAKLVSGVGALVLDDFDKGAPSEYGREVLFTAVDQRVSSGMPLLITSNLSLEDLGDRYGEWLPSRVAGYCELYEMEGPDRRLADAA